MASHFSILALRTPWTVWKGKMIGYRKRPGDGDGQGGLACCDSWGRKESDATEWLKWTELNCSIWKYMLTEIDKSNVFFGCFSPPLSVYSWTLKGLTLIPNSCVYIHSRRGPTITPKIRLLQWVNWDRGISKKERMEKVKGLTMKLITLIPWLKTSLFPVFSLHWKNVKHLL